MGIGDGEVDGKIVGFAVNKFLRSIFSFDGSSVGFLVDGLGVGDSSGSSVTPKPGVAPFLDFFFFGFFSFSGEDLEIDDLDFLRSREGLDLFIY